jgi:enoyl-CoA hydratase/carnithine racemase
MSGNEDAALVRRETTGGIAVLTLANPRRRNALSGAMLSALAEALAQIEKQAAGDSATVRAVVLRADGPVFSAGHDLRELTTGAEPEHRALFALCTNVMEAIRLLPVPVLAEVHALATAAGCQLAASCDLIVASESASFATPGVQIGLFCTTPGVAVARALPLKRAMEMLLTGDAMPAKEALAAGLVNRVVPSEKLHEETMALARRIIGASADTLARGKRAFYRQVALDVPAAYAFAEKEMVENAATPDAKEGMTAFLEKRPPKWK